MLIGIFSGLHIHIVEHHAAQVPACAQHGVLGVIELIRGRHAGSRYEHHTVDIGGDDLRIRHRVDRRRVDDHIIVGLGALRREAPHALGREQLGRVWRDRTGADDPQRQILHLGKLEPADLRQKVTQAGRAPHAPETALPRFAHIRIDKQNALAEHGVADGNVCRREALALRWLCARDGKGRAGALLIRRHAKQQAGAQLYIGLFDRKRRLFGQQPL